MKSSPNHLRQMLLSYLTPLRVIDMADTHEVKLLICPERLLSPSRHPPISDLLGVLQASS